MGSSAVNEDRDVSTKVIEPLLGYVRRVLGEEGVARTLALAGLGEAERAVTEPGGWCSTADVLALAEAAAAVCRDPEIGRRSSEENFRLARRDGTTNFFLDLGSVEAAADVVISYADKMSVHRTFRVTASGPGSLDVTSSYDDRAVVGTTARYFCATIVGYLSQLPGLFGVAGTAVELACRHLGDDHCLTRLVWDTDDTAPAAGLRENLVSLERFEQLQATTAEMVGTADIDEALERVVGRTAVTVLAPKIVLVARIPGEHRPRVHHVGVDPDELDAIVARMVADQFEGDEGVMCVPIASARNAYGHLAAILPAGAAPDPYEHRLLVSFAGHAVSALDNAVSLEAARRSQATAETLLDLAGKLATAGGTTDVCRRLAETVPVVTGADVALVWLWDPESETTSVAAAHPADRGLEDLAMDRRDVPDPVVGLAFGPGVIDAGTATPGTAAAMRAAGARHAVTVPITAHGDYFGTLMAGYAAAERPVVDQQLLERLRGLADQGAGAIANARLLDRIRHQALHDSMTGLPTRRLMEDRADQVLASARRSGSTTGLLFVDLDHFKEVNDTYGHAVGDALIRAVASRLVGCIRASDTVSRYGGDELLLLLPSLSGANEAYITAVKVLEELSQPFVVGDVRLHVSASIGVATDVGGRLTYDELLHHADLAMYEAKDEGRNAIAVYQGRHPGAARLV